MQNTLLLKLLPILGAALFTACAAPTLQTDALTRGPRDVPEAAQIKGVPFIKQTDHYCGPASLTMVMNFDGNPVTVDEIASEVYTPEKKGTLQQDMIGSARRNGMLAVQINGLESLTKEIDAGQPVIVFLNLGLSWYPIYHYAVVTGYDLREPEVVLHSGSTENKHWSMRKFERNWDQSWGLVVLPPSKLAVAGSEMEHAAAGAGLEALGKTAEAEQVYKNMLGRWPDSFGALFGLGNIAYAKKNYEDAVDYLRRATRAHPENSAAWHNRALAEGMAGHETSAHQSALRALSLAPPTSQTDYKKDLGAWLFVEH